MEEGGSISSPLREFNEGKVRLKVSPGGKSSGPGTKGGVFFNPAMVQNRDLSIVFLQYLASEDMLPGREKRVLDGLCGSGARSIRIATETDLSEKGIDVTGTDIHEESIRQALENRRLNSAEVEFINNDVNLHLLHERYSYIDIDPFGSPAPFLQSALLGVLNGGYIGVTATDTAALTGSIPRVARRRYGIITCMTHAYQEIACRSLMGFISRTAATFERSVDPILFYSSDHFVRGYIRVRRGAGRADRSLDNLGWIRYSRPGPPAWVGNDPGDSCNKEGRIMGPLWIGPLSDPRLLGGISEMLKDRKRWGYLSSFDRDLLLLERAVAENDLPMLGYDVDALGSFLKTSPLSMDRIFRKLSEMDRKASRSRHSNKIFKTDGAWEEVLQFFKGGS